MKSHIGPSGPGRCSAGDGRCPYGGDENHFSTLKDAQQAYETRLAAAYGTVASLKVSKEKLSKKEQELREKNAELVKELLELRGEAADGLVYEDANPERAKKRLQEAVDFAQSRGNTHLINKLASARVLPSGSFKTAEGTRVNTDKVLRAKAVLNHVENEREKALAMLTSVARSEAPQEKKFMVRTPQATYSLTVGEGLDEGAFEALPARLKTAISSEKESLNLDLAREHLDPATLAKITTSTQVADYVMGKPPAVTGSSISYSLPGKTSDEKLKAGLESVAKFYDGVTTEHGKLKATRDELATGTEAIKQVAASHPGNTFAPARSQWNGIVVSGRQAINSKAAHELLSPAELAAITVKTPQPDPAKARELLSEADFDKIFKAAKVSLRVTEAK